MYSTPSGILISAKLVREKALAPIRFTVDGIVTLVKLDTPLNKPDGILSIPDSKLTSVIGEAVPSS